MLTAMANRDDENMQAVINILTRNLTPPVAPVLSGAD